MIKIELPFDESIFKEQNILNFNLAWKDNLYKNKKNLFWSILIILISYLLSWESKISFIYIGIGLYLFINTCSYYFRYRKTKLKHLNLITSESEKYKRESQNIVWEFHDEYFSYRDFRYELKIIWKEFDGYRIVDKDLFLDIRKGLIATYILNEKEVKKEIFEEIKAFVKEKTSTHKPPK